MEEIKEFVERLAKSLEDMAKAMNEIRDAQKAMGETLAKAVVKAKTDDEDEDDEEEEGPEAKAAPAPAATPDPLKAFEERFAAVEAGMKKFETVVADFDKALGVLVEKLKA